MLGCGHPALGGERADNMSSALDHIECHISGCQSSNVIMGGSNGKVAVSRVLCIAVRNRKMVVGPGRRGWKRCRRVVACILAV